MALLSFIGAPKNRLNFTYSYSTNGNSTLFLNKMPNINLELSRDIVSALTKLIESISIMFKHNLAFDAIVPTDDPDLAVAWKQDLMEQLQLDCDYLIAILIQQDIGKNNNIVSLDDHGIEVTLRVASAIRLKLRTVFFSELTDEELEDAMLNPANIPPHLDKPFTCYQFLAGLQETLIRAIEPNMEI